MNFDTNGNEQIMEWNKMTTSLSTGDQGLLTPGGHDFFSATSVGRSTQTTPVRSPARGRAADKDWWEGGDGEGFKGGETKKM